MTNKQKFLKALDEALREAFRDVILSILPILMGGINSDTGNISIKWHVVLAVGLLAFLRVIDRYMHVYNSLDKDGVNESRGLVRTNW